MTDWRGCTPLVSHKRTGTAQFYHPPGHRRRDSLLPCSLTGRVFCSLEDTCGPAYLGALEQAAKAMAQVDGLQGVMGGDICWGDEALAEGRWHGLLESGARDGTELQQVWRILQMEAFQSASWLEKDLDGMLSLPVQSIGDGSTSGARRGKILEERDQSRGLLLKKDLELHPSKEARAVWSWPQRDELSSQWLLCMPGHDTSLSPLVFL